MKQISNVLGIDIILNQLVLDMLESEPLWLGSSLKPQADQRNWFREKDEHQIHGQQVSQEFLSWNSLQRLH